jgi:hypothetical protein
VLYASGVRIDLHCHSTCSDGTEAAAVVGQRASERACVLFALTDHDTCAGVADVAATVPAVIRAVELSCDHEGRTIHVLAYQRGGEFAPILDKLETLRVARANRLRVMAAKLAQRGIALDISALLVESERRSVGRPDLARLMVAQGRASSKKDAFARHLYDDGPVDVPHKGLALGDAIAAARACNAALSLAHPHLYDALSVKLLRAGGIGGVEAYYGAYDPRERARWLTLAAELGLVVTGGSDWHGADSHTPVGIEVPDDVGERLMHWLR